VERALLQALQARLSEEPRAILARQIEAVHYIYRTDVCHFNIPTPTPP
jgi:hypothetical protein